MLLLNLEIFPSVISQKFFFVNIGELLFDISQTVLAVDKILIRSKELIRNNRDYHNSIISCEYTLLYSSITWRSIFKKIARWYNFERVTQTDTAHSFHSRSSIVSFWYMILISGIWYWFLGYDIDFWDMILISGIWY